MNGAADALGDTEALLDLAQLTRKRRVIREPEASRTVHGKALRFQRRGHQCQDSHTCAKRPKQKHTRHWARRWRMWQDARCGQPKHSMSLAAPTGSGSPRCHLTKARVGIERRTPCKDHVSPVHAKRWPLVGSDKDIADSVMTVARQHHCSRHGRAHLTFRRSRRKTSMRSSIPTGATQSSLQTSAEQGRPGVGVDRIPNCCENGT